MTWRKILIPFSSGSFKSKNIKSGLSLFTNSNASLPLEAVARPLGDGVYTVTLEQGGSKLDCHLRLVGSGRRLILYLADKPYHQIIFERQ